MNNRKSKYRTDDRKTISKKIIALIQLRDAINLYYCKSYISSITLGAAAEEILGKLSDEAYSRKLGRPVKYNHANESAFLIAHFISNYEIDLSVLNKEQQKQYYDEIEKQFISGRNKIRNELKHKNKGKKEVVFSNFKKVAEEHIAGAIVNYKLYKNELPEDEIILKYSVEKGIN